MKQNSEAQNKIAKILLLGAGESGKSTVAKQLRLLYGNGFNRTELLQYQLLIMTNAIEGITTMLRLAEISNLPLDNPTNETLKELIYNADLNFQASSFETDALENKNEDDPADNKMAYKFLEQLRPVMENFLDDNT